MTDFVYLRRHFIAVELFIFVLVGQMSKYLISAVTPQLSFHWKCDGVFFCHHHAIRSHTQKHTYTHTNTSPHTHIHTYTHTNTHTHTHIHKHTDTYSQGPLRVRYRKTILITNMSSYRI